MGKYIKNNRPLNTLGKRESLMEADDRYFSSKPTNDIKIKKFVREYEDEIKDDIDNDTYDEYGMWSKYLDMFIMDFPKNKLTISEFAIKFFDEINKKFGTDFHYGYTREGLDDYANRWEKKARDQARGITKTTKYYVDGYYDDKYRGLANSEVFDDGDEAREYVWGLLQKGNYVKVNGNHRLSPDDVQEPEDIPLEWFMENLKEAYIVGDPKVLEIIRSDKEYGRGCHNPSYTPDFSSIPNGTKIVFKEINHWHPDVKMVYTKLGEDNWEETYYYKGGQQSSTISNHQLVHSVDDLDSGCYESLNEDTVKQGNKWVNKGNTGKTHGEFKTKKQADAQRKAMFVNKKKNSNWGK